MKDLKNIKIGVFRGGVSAEREVSLVSGAAVFDALKVSGYDVVDCVIDDAAPEYIEDIVKQHGIELVFIVLHGEFGEDGTLQQILDDIGVKYTGSGSQASRDAMDKVRTHEIMQRNNISMPNYSIGTESRILNPESFPVVVKPAAAGSSFGVSIVKKAEEFRAACNEALKYSDTVLVEKYIKGRELTVGILGDTVLPVVEIRSRADFYDYKSKYEDDATEFIVPADIPDNIVMQAEKSAKQAYDALGCAGAVRVDFLLDDDERLYVLELNTIPGMTSHSLLPLAASKNGLSFFQVCEKIIQLSYI